MTYLRFHLLLVVPWVVLGVLAQPGAWVRPGVLPATLITLAIVYAFTVPWDNWAVKRGIWDFPTGKFTRRWLYLPLEEYAFFGLQTVMAIGLTLALESRISGVPWLVSRPPIAVCAAVVLVWGLLGRALWSWPGRHARPAYAFHMLFWMLPVVVLQWVLGPDLLAPRLPLIATVVFCVGGYLSLADVLAVRWNLWFFDPRQILGPKLFGVLPWEEVIFFHLTTLLVVQSLLLWRSLLPY